MKYYVMGKKKEKTTYVRIERNDTFRKTYNFDAIDFDPTYHLNEKINCDKVNKLNSQYDNLYTPDYYYDVNLTDIYTNGDIVCIEEVELDREFHSGSLYKLNGQEYIGNIVYNSGLNRWEIHIDYYAVETIEEHKDNAKVRELYNEYKRLLKEYYDTTKEDNEKLESENKESLLAKIKKLFNK